MPKVTHLELLLFTVCAIIAKPKVIVWAQPPAPGEIIQRSIEFHDPQKQWGTALHEINLLEKRPKGSDRQTKLRFDLQQSFFQMQQTREGHKIIASWHGPKEVKLTIDGDPNPDDELIEKFRLHPDRIMLLKNYYIYLYGLPMKLNDPGTRIDQRTRDTTFQGQNVYAIRVTYDQNVGDDIWYFYFDKGSYALVGYQFFHDEAARDGEYITLENLAPVGRMKISQARKWYTNDANKFLGEDLIVPQ